MTRDRINRLMTFAKSLFIIKQIGDNLINMTPWCVIRKGKCAKISNAVATFYFHLN